MEALLIYCLLENSPPISEREADAISYNELTVALRGRQPGLPLVYGGGHRNLRDWAREICQHMTGICEVLDGEDPARPYQSALAAQLACIEAPETLPSARLLQSLRNEQLPFSDFVMQRSLAHQKALLQQRLPTGRALEFQRIATDSVAEQRALEQAPAPPFDEFLRSYFGGS